MARAALDSLGRRGHAGLIAQCRANRTHARGNDQRIGAQQLTHVMGLHRRAHNAVDTVGLGELCQASGLFGNRRLDADLCQRILIHARKHGDGNELGAVLTRFLGALTAGSEHSARAQTVDREQVCTGKRCRTGGTAYLMRNVMELKVEEDLKAQFLERLDDLGTLGVIERHTHLEPGGMARKLMGELERTLTVAVKGDDNAVAGIGL